MTILVVDDTSFLLLEYVEHVTDLGYDVLTATSGADALRLLSDRDNEITLVITDVDMKNGNGYELVRALVGNRRGIPILVHSASKTHIDGSKIIALEGWAKMMMVGYGTEIAFHRKIGDSETPEVYIRKFLERNATPVRSSMLAAE